MKKCNHNTPRIKKGMIKNYVTELAKFLAVHEVEFTKNYVSDSSWILIILFNLFIKILLISINIVLLWISMFVLKKSRVLL